MKHDFDTVVDRSNTGSVKWDRYGARDILPMWVADMDFQAPLPIRQALTRRVENGVFGYTKESDQLVRVVLDRLANLHGWQVEAEWLVWLPGVITGLNLACRATGAAGDEVITTAPVYYPFLDAPGNSDRTLVTAPLAREDGRWTFDYEAFVDRLTDRTRLFILCNPYNPVGRVFTREELLQICQICADRNIVICSDEIHGELILDADLKHIPTATLGSEIARKTITLIAPSKTFNLPGLNCAIAVIPDPDLRAAYESAAAGIVPHVTVLGYAAAEAAYSECEEWRQDLLDYLRGNRDYLEREIAALPGLELGHVEATYLAWIDARGLGVRNPCSFFEQAGVGLDDGGRFQGPGFVRLNFGCSRATLERAVEMIRKAVKDHAGA